MSDSKPVSRRASDDLPELPDLPELEELEGIELPGAIPAGASSAAGTAQAREAAAAAAQASGERPPLRVLDKAPFHLRKAAVVCTVGALLPFLGHGGGWITAVVAKALVLLGLWMWLKQIDHNYGPKLSGFLGNLAEMRFSGKGGSEDDKKKRARRMQEGPTALEHPFPTGLHLAALVLVLGGVLGVPFLDHGGDAIKGVAEVGMLAWAFGTFVHIHSYERWGKFSPIFPLMFIAFVFAGISRVIAGLGGSSTGLTKLAAIVGGGIVAAGGVLAAYTIVEAMMAAKREGDIKKQAALDARKAARAARKPG